MIQALYLIFDPAAGWKRFSAKGHSWTDIFTRHLIPLLMLVSVTEGYGLKEWGRSRKGISVVETLPVGWTVLFELARCIIAVGVVLWAATFIKSQSNSFYGRNTWGQAFAVAAYGLSPTFLRIPLTILAPRILSRPCRISGSATQMTVVRPFASSITRIPQAHSQPWKPVYANSFRRHSSEASFRQQSNELRCRVIRGLLAFRQLGPSDELRPRDVR